ncbi:ESX secretion-associated protein EspG [Amycolatopsis suaedae]|uniref:ESX secretion-associated protein EspG n=1 Tax=Amycolatopsis suaedae TaxID=2510978 RepID=A0A4Q7J503_9PSEU|nr:ESX secretion-associated protein EspG [Amycolatopsis suaedae]RZQ61752.1 ESX secretion-associated protein EspG [Amycolatopsis suaedae]
MTVTQEQPITLPLTAFTYAWKWQGFGPVHPALATEENWADADTLRELEGKVVDGLNRAGLARGGAVTKPFRDLLAVAARAEREFYAWVGQVETGRSAAILTAADADGRAVRLFRDDAHIRIDRVRPEALAQGLVDLLPRVPGAPVPRMTVPKQALGSGAGEQLDRLMRAKRTGLHTVYVALPDGSPNRAKRSSPMTLVDIAGQGRVLTYTDGQDQVICVPGTPELLVKELQATETTLRRR